MLWFSPISLSQLQAVTFKDFYTWLYNGYIPIIRISLIKKKKKLKYFHFLLLEGIIQDSHFTAQNYDPNLCFCINLPHLASRPACYQLPGPQVTFSPRSSSHQEFKILTSFSSFFSELYIFPEFIINL